MDLKKVLTRNRRQVIWISAAIAAVILISPVAMYGSDVMTASVVIGLDTQGGSLEGLICAAPMQAPGSDFDPEITDVQVLVARMTPHQYTMARNTERVSIRGGTGRDVAHVTIAFELVTPSGETRYFEFEPTGESGPQEISVLLGPEDGIVAGEFSLTITVSIRITPPGFEAPIVDKALSPVARTFTVPES